MISAIKMQNPDDELRRLGILHMRRQAAEQELNQSNNSGYNQAGFDSVGSSFIHQRSAFPFGAFSQGSLPSLQSHLANHNFLLSGISPPLPSLVPSASALQQHQHSLPSLSALRSYRDTSALHRLFFPFPSPLPAGGLSSSLRSTSTDGIYAETRATFNHSMLGSRLNDTSALPSRSDVNPHEEVLKPSLGVVKSNISTEKPTAPTTSSINKKPLIFNAHGGKLPRDFEPSDNSVIIGRTKQCYTSPGNLRLRDLCLAHLPAYSNCTKKKDKSQFVSDIVQMTRERCPEGGAFVKKEHSSGRWVEVKDVVARERVASIFRDFLHDQYRSSSKSKVAKRREKRVNEILKEEEEEEQRALERNDTQEDL